MGNINPLGNVIDGRGDRDAVHVAIAPAEAGSILSAGMHVRLQDGKAYMASSDEFGNIGEDAVGIVDPFLRTEVLEGQMFYIALYPNTVTGMRHHWSAPGFEDEAPTPPENEDPMKAESEKWLRDFADEADLSYGEVISAAEDWIGWEEFYVQNDREDARDAMGRHGAETFWHHYQVVTGTEVPEEKQQWFFSCSC